MYNPRMFSWDRKKSFTALIRPHLSAMYQAAWRWTRERQTAEDLVQDALCKLVNRVDELQQIEQLRPWLVRIVYRQFVDHYRRQQRSPVILADLDNMDMPADDDPLVLTDRQKQLTRALDAITADQRDAILMHDVEGYTAQEVATILDISVGTVKSRLHRGRLALRAQLEKRA